MRSNLEELLKYPKISFDILLSIYSKKPFAKVFPKVFSLKFSNILIKYAHAYDEKVC